jgi:hypothetical protein
MLNASISPAPDNSRAIPFHKRIAVGCAPSGTVQFPIRPGCLFAAFGKGKEGGGVSHVQPSLRYAQTPAHGSNAQYILPTIVFLG